MWLRMLLLSSRIIYRSIVSFSYAMRSRSLLKNLGFIAIDFVLISDDCYESGKRLVSIYNQMVGACQNNFSSNLMLHTV